MHYSRKAKGDPKELAVVVVETVTTSCLENLYQGSRLIKGEVNFKTGVIAPAALARIESAVKQAEPQRRFVDRKSQAEGMLWTSKSGERFVLKHIDARTIYSCLYERVAEKNRSTDKFLFAQYELLWSLRQRKFNLVIGGYDTPNGERYLQLRKELKLNSSPSPSNQLSSSIVGDKRKIQYCLHERHAGGLLPDFEHSLRTRDLLVCAFTASRARPKRPTLE